MKRKRPPKEQIVESPREEDVLEGPTVIETVKALHAGTINGKSLSVSARRACVEYLHTEGSSIPEIARLLDVCEKTIGRDRKAIQEAYAIDPDPRLVPVMVGRLCHEAELAINRIRRATRDKEAEPGIRIDGEHRCYQIYSDLVQRAQHLGYLPTATQRIEANLRHQMDDLPPVDDLMLEVNRLRVFAEESKDSQMTLKLGELLKITAHANLAHSVAELKAAAPAKGSTHAARA
jgi:hypothetical protein